MELTGKCKEQFTEWLYNNHGGFINEKCGLTIQNFKFFPQPMKYGVYVDFFDGVGIHITDGSGRFKLPDSYFYWVIEVINIRGSYENINLNDARPKNRIDAIKKANEIFNNQ